MSEKIEAVATVCGSDVWWIQPQAQKIPDRTALCVLSDAERVIDNLRAEVEALRKDAERYRFIRDADACESRLHVEDLCLFFEELDTAVDAAMAAKEGEL